jgi:hypothetical protein
MDGQGHVRAAFLQVAMTRAKSAGEARDMRVVGT